MAARSPLVREEYIEQEYFFRIYRERLLDNMPSQDILKTIHEEILATTSLPMAIDIMRAEILHSGKISTAMRRLGHYFTPFQTFVMDRAEDDVSRFEQVTGLEILEREARYRSRQWSQPGLFIYQFECLARNRLGYHDGLTAIAADTAYDEPWSRWIQTLRSQLGAYELADLVFRASEHYQNLKKTAAGSRQPATINHGDDPSHRPLFAAQAGRIAKANVGRDPLYFFAALQRQLDYPEVPLSRKIYDETLPPFLEGRLNKIEQRLKIVEMEQKGGIDLTKFYRKDDESAPGGIPADFED